MLSVNEAQALIHQSIFALDRTESVSFAEAVGRILAEPIVADKDFPPFTRSAMDGYALRAEDPANSFTIIETIHPGQPPLHALSPGTCSRIFTGAALPPNANCVIKQEEAHVLGKTIQISPALKKPDLNLRHQGEDFLQGTTLISQGTQLNAAHLAIAASVGATRLKVHSQPKLFLLSTGDELVSPELTPSLFQIRNVNSILLKTLVEKDQGCILKSILLKDNYPLLKEHFQEALCLGADVILLSGGASVGEKDYVKQLLHDNNFILHFSQVNVRPGQPFIFATRDKTIAFGIPGNPVSHLVCYLLFVRLALKQLQGMNITLLYNTLPLAQDFDYKPTPRETFWPAKRICMAGSIQIEPLAWNGSGHISSLAKADSLIRLPPHQGPFLKGEFLSWIALD